MGDGVPHRPTASVRRRIAAHAVDAVVIALGGGALMVVASALLGPSVSIRDDPSSGTILVLEAEGLLIRSAILTAGSGAYFTLSWAGHWRATPGQRILGMSVVSARDSDGLGLARAGLRWLALGGPLGMIAAATVESPAWWLVATFISLGWTLALLLSTWRSPSMRGLHDRLADSLVVR